MDDAGGEVAQTLVSAGAETPLGALLRVLEKLGKSAEPAGSSLRYVGRRLTPAMKRP